MDTITTISWQNHDAWSEMYIGIHQVIYNDTFPKTIREQMNKPDTNALCQLVLVGANHMMEFTLFKLLKPKVNASDYENANYDFALTEWVKATTDQQPDLMKEPLKSTELLRKYQNEVLNPKISAIATVDMARSALYSVVEGTKALYNYFEKDFIYTSFINQYPISTEQWFSEVILKAA